MINDATVMAAARAHGMLKVLVESTSFGMPDIHKPQAMSIVNELAAALFPGDETMKVKERTND